MFIVSLVESQPKPSIVMEPKLYAENISYAEFQERLRSYEDHVPEKIQGLEELRLRQVPEVLSQRREDGNAFLEKTEVTGLVEWKLYVHHSMLTADTDRSSMPGSTAPTDRILQSWSQRTASKILRRRLKMLSLPTRRTTTMPAKRSRR